MDTERTLLEAIRRDPADDLAWAALADALEEAGEAQRADLARLTLRARRMPTDGPLRPGVEGAVAVLLRAGARPSVPEVTNSLGMRFALVPAGVGLLGTATGTEAHQNSEQPHQPVEYTSPFWMSVFPVTQGEYAAVRRRRPSVFKPGGKHAGRVKKQDTSDFPVDSVSWREAAEFCTSLSRRKEEREAGRSYRLPTEAEWEYACRAAGGVSGLFLFGDTITSDVANFNGTRPFGDAPQGPNLERTCAVGAYPPNALGLYDLTGNVWEWVEDWFSRDGYAGYARVAPRGAATGTAKVLRGGSWSSYGWGCRISYRNCITPDAKNNNFGLRPVLVQGGG